MADDGKHHEIVIIRRGGHGDHDEHHGGVWKIAFADFMTAMMAFFLVMWLISANDKTRASVARYFNPVRLVDATTQPRGLHDPKKDESGITASPDTKKPASDKGDTKKEAAQAAPPQKETSAQKEKRLDGALRDNPLAALAEIASTSGQGDRNGGTLRSATPVIGRRGGEAFRDPFAPPPPAPTGQGEGDEAAAEALAADVAAPRDARAARVEKVAVKTIETAEPDLEAARKSDAEAKAVLGALQAGPHDAPGPKVEVRRTPEGLVLSLTDTADFAMFANGSAVPARQVVLMMDRVAGVIRGKPGTVIVRGYTDNKPYRGKRYDNWHLSLDRAQVAHYMLVHGGLDDARVAHVEGYADRGVRPGVDPASPLNRRIEILLKDAG